MTHKINNNVVHIGVLAIIAILFSIALTFLSPQPAQAAAGDCNTLDSSKGLATHSESDVAAGDYTVYARVKVASGDATFDLGIDGAGKDGCFNYKVSEGGSNGNWVWHSSTQKLNWTGGDMKFQMSGDKSGVGLDCIVLAQGTFNPSTKEDCNPTDTNPDPDPCTPVTFGQASGVVSSFLTGNLSTAAKDFDKNSNGKIDFGEASGVVSSFLRKACL